MNKIRNIEGLGAKDLAALNVLVNSMVRTVKQPAQKLPAAKAKKHDKLLEALAVERTRQELMDATGFDSKNLSTALGNLARKGYTIARGQRKSGEYTYVIPATKRTRAAH